ncbi:MAG: hypothetical protein VYA26_03650 [Actinomycetota bacterium]|nr:hypothetical protein [Actinomycetota bacterium]MED5393524.1 hypothetical protein [Actinomycetota bacterium]MEE3352910.1 hypothetical protein [Actinomycetota bacterium]
MNDPILVRRARLAHFARLGQRLGYLAYGVAILVFAMGMATGFNGVVANTLVVLLVVGSFVLAPAIVLHYAVRAAIDEERGEEQNETRGDFDG